MHSCTYCNSDDILFSIKKNIYVCGDCNRTFFPEEKATVKDVSQKRSGLQLFFSYGHDNNAEIVERIQTIRTDYYYCENAPKPNSIKSAAAVALFNSKKEILLLHRRDNGKWTMPGGTLEFGESLTSCALREVKEECGLDVEIKDIVGTYTDPNIIVAYSDGEVRQEFTIVYYGEVKNFEFQLNEESSSYQLISLDTIKNLPLVDSQRRRLDDVMNYIENGQRTLL